ncbi:MAG: 23S rRNA (guanosine(2251)-2'-O)-methyltransferase RlmB [Anaerolineae bacterium]|nr:23S rRNA (guanosine(2251)-2'-O)-methyltransferase RlmB [Anaerolineae bacterium]
MSQSYIYGFHAINKMLQHSPQSCVELICTEGKNPRLLSLIGSARQARLPIRFESRELLSDLSGGAKHQGCVLQIVESSPNALTLDQLLQQNHNRSLYLVLDGVQDPHNLGACLRTADATGVDAVIIPKDRSAGLTATVRKVAAGGAESVPLLEVTNIARSLKEMKKAGIWIYGTSGEAIADVYQYSYDSAVALVMGAEGDGLRRLTAEQCDHLVKLPMLGTVESLNVSVATGVCLYEILRSRMSCS